MGSESIVVSLPHVTISISQPSTLYFKLKYGKTEFTSAPSPSTASGQPGTLHSWTLNTLTFTTTLEEAERSSLKIEIWQKWNWPWNDTLAAEGEVLFSKLLKNHCTLAVSDARRGSQAVSITTQSIVPQITCAVHCFPETASPAHWRSLFAHHTTKWTALQDLVYLFERGKDKGGARAEKWSSYCDRENLILFVELLKAWSLGELPQIHKKAAKNTYGQQKNRNEAIESDSDESSSEGEEDATFPNDDEALSPITPRSFPNLVCRLWTLIGSIDLLRSKLGPLGLPLLIIDMLPDAFANHPRHALFLLDLLRPYIAHKSPMTQKMIAPYCDLLEDFTHSLIASMFPNLVDQLSISPTSTPRSELSSSETSDPVQSLPSTDSNSIASSSTPPLSSPISVKLSQSESERSQTPSSSAPSRRASLLLSSPSESNDMSHLPRLTRDDEDEEAHGMMEIAMQVMQPISPPRRSSTKPSAAVMDPEMKAKREKRMRRRETKAQLKEDRRRLWDQGLRERSKTRLVTTMFQHLKYFDPSYIPIILKTGVTQAINAVLSTPEAPANLLDLSIDTLKFIGPHYTNVLDSKHCFENLALLISQTKDVTLKLRALSAISDFRPASQANSFGASEILNMFVQALDTESGGANKDSKGVLSENPRIAALTHKFLRFLADANDATKQIAVSHPATVNVLLETVLGPHEASRKAALGVLPNAIPIESLLRSQFLPLFSKMIRDKSQPWRVVFPTFMRYLRSILIAPVYAPEHPWADVPAGVEQLADGSVKLPAFCLKWSDMNTAMRGELSQFFTTVGDFFRNGMQHPISSANIDEFYDAIYEFVSAMCSAKRPMLDLMIFQAYLISKISETMWSKDNSGLPASVTVARSLPMVMEMMSKTWRLGFWKVSNSLFDDDEGHGKDNYKTKRVIPEWLKEPSSKNPQTFEDVKFARQLNLARVKEFFVTLNSSMRSDPHAAPHFASALAETRTWEGLALMLSVALRHSGLDLPDGRAFLNTLSRTNSIHCFAFYVYFLDLVLQASKHRSVQLGWIECLANGICYFPQRTKNNKHWAYHVIPSGIIDLEGEDMEIPDVIRDDLISQQDDEKLFNEYLNYFNSISYSHPILLETDSHSSWKEEYPAWESILPVPATTTSTSKAKTNRYAKVRRAPPLPKPNGSLATLNLETFATSPAPFPKPHVENSDTGNSEALVADLQAKPAYSEFQAHISSATSSDAFDSTMEERTTHLHTTYPFPLRKIVEISSLLETIFDSITLPIYRRGNHASASDPLQSIPLLKVAEFLLDCDPLFADRFFGNDKILQYLKNGTMSEHATNLVMHMIVKNLRHEKVNAVLFDAKNVGLFVGMLKDVMSQDFTSMTALCGYKRTPIPIPAIYHMLTRWVSIPECRTHLANSGHVDFFITKTVGTHLPSGAASHFYKLWMQLLEPMVREMHLNAALKVLGSFPSSNGEFTAVLAKLFTSKIEEAKENCRAAGKPFVLDTSVVFQKDFEFATAEQSAYRPGITLGEKWRRRYSSEKLKLWTYLWRSGCDLAHVAFALDDHVRNTDGLFRIIPPDAFTRFQDECNYSSNPNCSWLFLGKSDPLLLAQSASSASKSTLSSSLPQEEELHLDLESVSTATSSSFGLDSPSSQNDIPPRKPVHKELYVSKSLATMLDKEETIEEVLHEQRARVFRQAEFVAHICHSGRDRSVYFYPPAPIMQATLAINWYAKDPLIQLLACGFRCWDKTSLESIATSEKCRTFATQIVEGVLARLAYLEKEHPLVILAILQNGVLNSHLEYEYQLYPSLYRIFEQRRPERERAAAIVRDISACASRHRSELCRSIPIIKLLEECIDSENPFLNSAGYELLLEICKEPLIREYFVHNGAFRQKLMDSVAVIDVKVKNAKATAIYTLWQDVGQRILDSKGEQFASGDDEDSSKYLRSTLSSDPLQDLFMSMAQTNSFDAFKELLTDMDMEHPLTSSSR